MRIHQASEQTFNPESKALPTEPLCKAFHSMCTCMKNSEDTELSAGFIIRSQLTWLYSTVFKEKWRKWVTGLKILERVGNKILEKNKDYMQFERHFAFQNE